MIQYDLLIPAQKYPNGNMDLLDPRDQTKDPQGDPVNDSISHGDWVAEERGNKTRMKEKGRRGNVWKFRWGQRSVGLKEEKRSLEAGVTKGSPPSLLASCGLVRLEDSVALLGGLIPDVDFFLPRYWPLLRTVRISNLPFHGWFLLTFPQTCLLSYP